MIKKNNSLTRVTTIIVFITVFCNAHAAEKNIIFEKDWLTTNKVAINSGIIAPYRILAIQTQQLQQGISELCLKITPGTINAAQQRFRQTYLAWAKVQHITIGPMSFLKRRERFQYWPDKHAVGHRQLRKLTQQEEKRKSERKPLITLEQLQNKSVAVQGLPALERLLFSKKLLEKKQLTSTECHLTLVIARNLNELAQENIDAWINPPVNFLHDLTHLEEGLGIYQSSQEVANVLFTIFSTQLQVIKQLKLQRALGSENKISHPKRLEAWRSQLSFELLQNSLHSLHTLYREAFHNHLQRINVESAKKIDIIFLQLLKNESLSLYELLEKNPTPPKIISIISTLSQLQNLVDNDLRSALGFTSSFNALDGD